MVSCTKVATPSGGCERDGEGDQQQDPSCTFLPPGLRRRGSLSLLFSRSCPLGRRLPPGAARTWSIWLTHRSKRLRKGIGIGIDAPRYTGISNSIKRPPPLNAILPYSQMWAFIPRFWPLSDT